MALSGFISSIDRIVFMLNDMMEADLAEANQAQASQQPQSSQQANQPLPTRNLMRLGSNSVANANLTDPVTYEAVPHESAVYLKKNVNRGKVHYVYDYNTIRKWMKNNTSATSPMTGVRFTGQNVVRAFPRVDIEKTIRFLQEAATIMRAHNHTYTGGTGRYNEYQYNDDNLMGLEQMGIPFQ